MKRRRALAAVLPTVAVLLLALPAAARPAAPATAPATAAAARPIAPLSLLAPLTDGAVPALPEVDPAVPSPADFLGYPLGSRFTHHERILEYFDRLATTGRVKLTSYGTTYEGRPLRLAAISSPANLQRLELLREQRLRLADPRSLSSAAERSRLAAELPAVVWLAYGVHGDESSSSEAAMAVAYLLAAARGDLADGLEKLIVLVDPAVNPDGRERYVHFYEETQGRRPDPHPAAAEHWEPWPGGRYNHYLFDLNRDWAWATQLETRGRLEAYRAWEPQVYVDFHEMGSGSSYFFPPNAEPTHPVIGTHVTGFFEAFGRANAAAFDRLGWTYFASELFDLYYPAYGDSYPSLRGAVGMTYEVAGGELAGTLIERADGELLSLADRVARHLVSSLATVRTAAAEGRRLLDGFAASRAEAAAKERQTFLWSPQAGEGTALARLLALHGIEVQTLGASARLLVEPIAGAAVAVERDFAAGTFAVSTAQPLGDLVRALLDPRAPMSPAFLERQRDLLEADVATEFYDITAWALPLAYNVPTWTSAGALPRTARFAPGPAPSIGRGELGYLVAPQGLASYRLAARLAAGHHRFHVARGPLTADGERYPAGTLFVPRRDAATAAAVDALVAGAAQDGLLARRVASSFSEHGIFLGSNSMAAVRPARIGILGGSGTNVATVGHLWFLLDREIEAPVSRVALDSLDEIDLGGFDALVLAGSSVDALRRAVPEPVEERLEAWVAAGGILVAVGPTLAWLDDRELLTLEAWEPPKDDDTDPEDGPLAGRRLDIPGAALATAMAPHHPLTLGLATPPPFLFQGSTLYPAAAKPRRDAVTVAASDPVVAGFVWPEAEDRLANRLLVGLESKGRGAYVLFAQDPAFRGFWRGTMPLFLNAVLFAPSLSADPRY